MKQNKCKICRRLGAKLFLKGEKCLSPKCSMIRKSYPPGIKGKRRVSSLSEYGKELREKQKIKNWYNLSEHQLRKYVKESLGAKRENSAIVLTRKLETRLDNIIFRLGFAFSRAHARQLVSHNHFLVNKKNVNIPSSQLKKGDEVSIKQVSLEKKCFQDLVPLLGSVKPPSWLELNREKLKGKLVGLPSLEEAALPAEISAVFEYYSR